MIVSFIGHSKIKNHDMIKTAVFEILREIDPYNDLTFYCGGYGDFDVLCASAVRELKSVRTNVISVFVTPYIGRSYDSKLRSVRNSNLYDEIIYPEIERVPYKYAITARNKYIVDASDLIISYVVNPWGGAYSTLKYAERKQKKILYLPLILSQR